MLGPVRIAHLPLILLLLFLLVTGIGAIHRGKVLVSEEMKMIRMRAVVFSVTEEDTTGNRPTTRRNHNKHKHQGKALESKAKEAGMFGFV